ncbi:MAG TPA: GNAT family N-acetyltransferase [Anaerolineales bacterium]|nr:GNAT family N-acetyltransferase [Anaerolineales bacterium]HNB35139.1 GNAT family N-acetyltransferase [Anaerolineales bacterium]HNC07442.1 GNAT family N-acetyltransferase [Anaerolineales bacterium]
MSDIQVRPTIASDLSRLMGFDHSIKSDSVWQLEFRRDTGQVTTTFREVRLPRTIQVAYPHNPFSLADDWARRSMMYTALIGGDPVGYIGLMERGISSTVWVTDLAVHPQYRRQGLGRGLLASGQAWAESRAHHRLILEMPSKNLPTIRLAQKSGFEFCGYNDQYYLNKDVALFFARVLK